MYQYGVTIGNINMICTWSTCLLMLPNLYRLLYVLVVVLMYLFLSFFVYLSVCLFVLGLGATKGHEPHFRSIQITLAKPDKSLIKYQGGGKGHI